MHVSHFFSYAVSNFLGEFSGCSRSLYFDLFLDGISSEWQHICYFTLTFLGVAVCKWEAWWVHVEGACEKMGQP